MRFILWGLENLSRHKVPNLLATNFLLYVAMVIITTMVAKIYFPESLERNPGGAGGSARSFSYRIARSKEGMTCRNFSGYLLSIDSTVISSCTIVCNDHSQTTLFKDSKNTSQNRTQIAVPER